jgi:hypothetical protein
VELEYGQQHDMVPTGEIMGETLMTHRPPGLEFRHRYLLAAIGVNLLEDGQRI